MGQRSCAISCQELAQLASDICDESVCSCLATPDQKKGEHFRHACEHAFLFASAAKKAVMFTILLKRTSISEAVED